MTINLAALKTRSDVARGLYVTTTGTAHHATVTLDRFGNPDLMVLCGIGTNQPHRVALSRTAEGDRSAVTCSRCRKALGLN